MHNSESQMNPLSISSIPTSVLRLRNGIVRSDILIFVGFGKIKPKLSIVLGKATVPQRGNEQWKDKRCWKRQYFKFWVCEGKECNMTAKGHFPPISFKKLNFVLCLCVLKHIQGTWGLYFTWETALVTEGSSLFRQNAGGNKEGQAFSSVAETASVWNPLYLHEILAPSPF